MQIFLSAFEDVPDPRASNTRCDLVAVACDRLRISILPVELLRGIDWVWTRKRTCFQGLSQAEARHPRTTKSSARRHEPKVGCWQIGVLQKSNLIRE